MKLTRQHRALLTIVMRHPDSAHLLRRMAVVQRLTNGRGDYSIKELADYFHISKATMQRDIVSLRRDFPMAITAEGAQKRRFRIKPRWYFKPAPFHETKRTKRSWRRRTRQSTKRS